MMLKVRYCLLILSFLIWFAISQLPNKPSGQKIKFFKKLVTFFRVLGVSRFLNLLIFKIFNNTKNIHILTQLDMLYLTIYK